MATGQAAAPFVWGSGGRRMTPEEIAQERKRNAGLAQQAMDYSPIGHWTQGLNRIAQGLVAGYGERQAREAGALNAAEDQKFMNFALGQLGGGGFGPIGTGATGGASGGSSLDTVRPYTGELNAPEGLREGIISTAESLGIDPVDLATTISYETAGTFNPTKAGPTTQWGQHRGLIQFGEPQARQHGVDWNDPVNSQLGPNGAVASYLRDAGVKPGMGLLDIYSAINAGAPGLYDRTDENNGGAPGTVRDKVEKQMAGHRAKALALVGGGGARVASLDPSAGMAPVPAAAGGNRLMREEDMTPEDAARLAAATGRNVPDPNRVPYAGPGASIDVPQVYGGAQAPAGASRGVMDALMSGVNGARASMAEEAAAGRDPQTQIAQALTAPSGYTSTPYQPGQFTPPPTQGVDPRIIQALTSPYASESVKGVAQLLLQQQQGAQKAAQSRAFDLYQANEQRAYDQWKRQDDRAFDASVRQEGYSREDARNAVTDRREDARLGLDLQRFEREGNKPIQIGNRLLDPNTREVIYEAPENAQWQELPNGDFGYFDPASRSFTKLGNAPKPAQNGITIGPDGSVQIGGPFTEGQSKDNVYSTRARGSLPTLDQFGDSLMNPGDRLLDYDPSGQVRGGLQNPDYQVARAAGDEFLFAILRKDTGAAITPDEQTLYGGLYLPQPGDQPNVLAYKRQARERAVAAIEAGMSPAQMAAQERALQKKAFGSPEAAGAGGSRAPASAPAVDYRNKYGLE